MGHPLRVALAVGYICIKTKYFPLCAFLGMIKVESRRLATYENKRRTSSVGFIPLSAT
jgi:hypothetical protein